MFKRIFSTFVLSLAAAAFFSVNAFAAGWVKDAKGWWYQRADGGYPVSEWFQDTDGNWYYFDSRGYMLADTLSDDGYWLGGSGAWERGRTVSISDFVNVDGFDGITKTYDRYFIKGKSTLFDDRVIELYIDGNTKYLGGGSSQNGYVWFNEEYEKNDVSTMPGAYYLDAKDGHVENIYVRHNFK